MPPGSVHSRPFSAALRKGRLADSSQNRLSSNAAVSVEAVQVHRADGAGGMPMRRVPDLRFFEIHMQGIVAWLGPSTRHHLYPVASPRG